MNTKQTSFACSKSQIYINTIYVCDGKIDCLYEEDEENCHEDQLKKFFCQSDNMVISFASVCDFIQDCPDNSDENDCS